jgi:phage baseplate assembly protein W
MSEILGAGVAFPLQVDSRGALALARDEGDVKQAIALILSTAPGERTMRPEFGCGVHDYVFESIDASTAARIEDEVRSALDRWEPRIDVLDVAFGFANADQGLVEIEIAYRLRATNRSDNLVYPFYIVPAEEQE